MLDSETRLTLDRRRWRQPPLTHPAIALAVVLVLHALFVLALWYEMQPQPLHRAAVPVDGDQVLTVRLIDHSGKPHSAQPPAPPTLPKLVPAPQVVTPRVRPMSREIGRASCRERV